MSNIFSLNVIVQDRSRERCYCYKPFIDGIVLLIGAYLNI